MKESINKNFKRMLLAGPILILFLVIIQFVTIARFNSHVYRIKGGDTSAKTYLDLDVRKDSTSSWLKKDFSWKGQTLDLKAQTIDGTFYNNSRDIVNNWFLRIDITDDCFVNNAWCGTMEIHQYVGTENETIQLLDLRNYKLKDVKLAHFYDGDLLIPLKRGDYIIYTPSTKDSEIPVQAGAQLTMGVIFYYFDSLDFYHYRMDYTYHRTFTYGARYDVIVFLTILWLIGCVIYVISLRFYKDAQKQLELKKSGLLCMSDIYLIIHIIDLNTNELIPVINNDSLPTPKNTGANEYLVNLFSQHTTDAYRELVLKFCSIPTLAERMQDKNSIACEYLSRHLGWCSIRFFAMERIEGRTPDRVLFTIQVIDTEKREMNAIEERISQAEQDVLEKGALLHSISSEMLEPSRKIQSLNEQILAESHDEAITGYATELKHYSIQLSEIIHAVLDSSRIEENQLHLEIRPFPVRSLLEEIRENCAIILSKDRPVKMQFDIASTVPEIISGDKVQLIRVLSILIAIANEDITEGSICLSLFGKAYGDGVHLVFSVRDTNSSTPVREADRTGLRLAASILKLMGSKLNIVNSPQNGTEAYFELMTTAEGTTTLGDIDFNL